MYCCCVVVVVVIVVGTGAVRVKVSSVWLLVCVCVCVCVGCVCVRVFGLVGVLQLITSHTTVSLSSHSMLCVHPMVCKLYRRLPQPHHQWVLRRDHHINLRYTHFGYVFVRVVLCCVG